MVRQDVAEKTGFYIRMKRLKKMGASKRRIKEIESAFLSGNVAVAYSMMRNLKQSLS